MADSGCGIGSVFRSARGLRVRAADDDGTCIVTMDDAEPITPDMAIRRGYYAILQEATTDELERMVFAMRTNTLPRIPYEYRATA